ncbi:hypothetical protein ACWIUH_09985, partial [Ursidibacter arcticus]
LLKNFSCLRCQAVASNVTNLLKIGYLFGLWCDFSQFGAFSAEFREFQAVGFCGFFALLGRFCRASFSIE